jgi:serine phosphatase RsbU (regulator of sigma subunit)
VLNAVLRIQDRDGERRVPISKPHFRIGRSLDNDLLLPPTEVSRHHAVIALEEGHFVLLDVSSKLGTYVNGGRIAQHRLSHGDRIHLGAQGGVDLTFEQGAIAPPGPGMSMAITSAIIDIGRVGALLGGLRAISTGRVLHDVLALVLDAALAVTDADRAFIMLAGPGGELEFKLARGRGGETLADSGSRSHRVPAEVFATGVAQYFRNFPDEAPDADLRPSRDLRLRTVLCVPLVAFDLVDETDSLGRARRIGVLYLDSEREGGLLSATTRSALDALATNAAIAIENARLYREAAEKARLDQEMHVAAEIQQLLLPRASHVSDYCEAVGRTISCRSIGGDFFDYASLRDGRFAFALGDVAGKGPAAALLSTLVLGILADQRWDLRSPAETTWRLNEALALRAIEGRYVTLLCGELTREGRLTYCNAGHNPPILVGAGGTRRLEAGGPPAGMFGDAAFDQETVALAPGDRVIVCSDGVPEAEGPAGDEFGEWRLQQVAESSKEMDAAGVVDAIVRSVRAFAAGAPQRDDITALVVGYLGCPPSVQA